MLIRGPLAVAWTPLEFRVDGKRTHCGIDVFNLVEVDGDWLMTGTAWTVEPSACDELGALPEPAGAGQ